MNKWISVKDDKPKIGQTVWALHNWPEGKYEDNVASFKWPKEKCPLITHWIPLPKPPED